MTRKNQPERSRSQHSSTTSNSSSTTKSSQAKYQRTKSLTNPGQGIAAQKELDPLYRPINILIYRNGDTHDAGYVATITRKQFRNWVSFLEFARLKTDTNGAVHYIFTTDGKECRHFHELQDGARYVAAVGTFKRVEYGHRPEKYGIEPKERWNLERKAPEPEQKFLESDESNAAYLYKRKFDGNTKDMWEDEQWDRARTTKNKGSSLSSSSSQPDLSNSGLSAPKPYLHRSKTEMYKLKLPAINGVNGNGNGNGNDWSNGDGRNSSGSGANSRNGGSRDGRSSSVDGDSVAELILVTSKGELLSLPVHSSLKTSDITNNLATKPPKQSRDKSYDIKQQGKSRSTLSKLSRKTDYDR